MPKQWPTSLVFEPLLERAATHPERQAIGDVRRQLTYGELATGIECQAAVLRAAGIQPGDRVVLAAGNAVGQLVAHFAILRAGAVSVPLAGGSSSERLGFIVKDCQPKAICMDDSARGSAYTAAKGSCRLFALEELANSARATMRMTEPAGRVPDDIACLMYTTGSTGDPKAVVLSHRGIGNALSHIVSFLGCSDTDREAIMLPLSHSFGLGHAYCTLFTGGYIWVNNGLRPLKAVLDALSHNSINAMPTTPAMLRLLLGPYRGPFLHSAAGLRRMVVNSEPLPSAQAVEVLAALPKTDVIVYYGLTEASRSTFLRLRDEPPHRFDTVGRAAEEVEIGVCDEAGTALPPGGEGEVRIRGPHIAAGYWQRPEEQAVSFRDGWLHTGDLGAVDTNGYLTITGRLKDQINVGGLKVSGAEIERMLRHHPGIADVAVTGLPDPDGLRGEIVAVAVVSRDSRLTVNEVAAYCTRHLEGSAQPHRIVIVASIPRAESGKILRSEVRRLFVGNEAPPRA